jgi:phosphate transport system substrate-binding protein
MRQQFWSLGLTLALFSAGACAEDSDALPSYQPAPAMSGTIRSWGHGYLKAMMKLWEADFQRYQPGIRFEDDLVSSAAAMAGLYSGRADLAVLAREITPPEIAAYEKTMKQPVFPVEVLTGSFGNQDKIMALGVFVHKDNPISKLSFVQLDAIFGAEHRRGARENLRTWDQVGLAGDWKLKAIHPYSGVAFEAPAYFFSQTVLKGSVLWNCALTQFENVEDSTQRYVDAYQKAVDALGSDRFGIALAGAGYRNPNVKLVALAIEKGGPFVAATPENVANRSYPLARPVRFYIDNGPAKRADPAVLEFLRYVLSREGQQQVAREGDFLPLSAPVVRAQRARLP